MGGVVKQRMSVVSRLAPQRDDDDMEALAPGKVTRGAAGEAARMFARGDTADRAGDALPDAIARRLVDELGVDARDIRVMGSARNCSGQGSL